MKVDELIEFLDAIRPLLEIAAALNLKGLRKKRVDELIASLVRYYEKRRLPERMARRLPADDEAFMEEMRKKYKKYGF